MKKILTSIIFVILLTLCGVVIFFNVTHEYYDVLGPSMSPTINAGVVEENTKKDAVFVSKIKNIQCGDIVVATKLDNEGNSYHVIKRIIAMGGDKIKIEQVDGDNRIVIIKNGQTESVVLDEEYLSDYAINKQLKKEFTEMIILCDLQLDLDGFLLIPNDCVFLLGDNRSASRDSADYGPVKRSTIVGKVDYIIYGNSNPYGQVIQQFFGW